MQNITAQQVLTWCNGQSDRGFNLSGEINQVMIDSRKVTQNCLFVALKGENTDGHDYVAKILEEPSNYALVNADYGLELPNLIRVTDTTLALGQLASHYRQLFSIPLVGITGSNGKTTVKEMLKCVCQQKFGAENVLATSGNLNNQLGMPLTLLALNSKHRVAIIEMGMNHCGELDYLTNLAKPTLAVVNNVMFAHAGHFASLAEIAAAKGEIYAGVSQNGVACVDSNSPFCSEWSASLTARQIKIFEYGTPTSECYIREISSQGALIMTPQGELELQLQILGQHNYHNALTVIALALNLGCSLAEIKTGLESYSGYKGRLERKVAFNGALIVDDTYNANPDSVMAALSAVQTLNKPLWFIFGDLKELGSQELEFHRQIGEAAAALGVERLLTVGELAKYAAGFFSGEKIHFESNQDVVKYCFLHLPAVATLLIKGSNSMRLAEVATQLSKVS